MDLLTDIITPIASQPILTGTIFFAPLFFALGALMGLGADQAARRLVARPASGRRRRAAVAGLFGLFAAAYFWAVFGGYVDFAPNPTGLESRLCRYLVHLGAAWVLLVATLTDFDDYIIPDALMIPATLGAVIAMTVFPAQLPCVTHIIEPTCTDVHFGPLMACSTQDWPLAKQWGVGLGCWFFWCFALLDRRWYARLGMKRAGALFCRRLRQSPLTPILTLLAVLGGVGIALVSFDFLSSSFLAEQDYYDHLRGEIIVGKVADTDSGRMLSALIGLVIGMAMIWLVRIAGRLTLGREAMGFGDVVLMGFIGAIVGWQGAIVVFFLAPFAGLIFGLVRAAFRSEREIPYGPFLCLATVAVWFFWPRLWTFVEPVFSDLGAILLLGAIGAVLLVVLLMGIRLIKSFIFG